MDSSCIFCQIVAGNAPAAKVFEDHHTLAFLDINPINPGHCLVIPKAHHENLFSMDTQTYQAVASTTLLIARAINQSLQPAGMNIFQANGTVAGQTVFHLHNHLLPRLPNDSLKVEVHGMQTADPLQLIEIAATIQESLKS